ncbi:lipoprotein [Actinoplanes sp. L3-i22]|uniref:lipoprotein n=1 Tax=Actinoplanes sp. L3-i22 TaxID=2836373 RepID=UPI001C74753D|nr:lipoprotein [Actinoplanes sp. L3-i22]BCY12999.1 hypothetical protein L3i22_080870 [Actinoplanes sp. L3-i22]
MKILCRTTSLAALAALALTGCDTDDKHTPDPAAPSAPAVAAAGPRVGATGSGCALPVTFGLVTDWKPKQVTVTAGDPLAELAKKGPFTMACEIDAKPAGNLGFLRVWTGAPAGLRPSLEAFIGTKAEQSEFTELRVGDQPALEVDYRQKSELDDSLEPERAFVVDTGKGLVLISLDSFDGDEHQAMLPAYELARTSLAIA